MLHWERYCREWTSCLLLRPAKATTRTCTSTLGTAHLPHTASNYLHSSVIPTMHFQASLPRLPIPKLDDTQKRYLDAQKPFSTPEEHDEIREVTANFIANEGTVLQAKLKENDAKNSNTSYIAEAWYDRYLTCRDTVLSENAYIAMKEDLTTTDQLIRATKLIHASLKFKKSLDDSLLEPDVYHLNPSKSDTKLFRQVTRLLPARISCYGAYFFKAFPLDMSQYERLFNSTRIPKPKRDVLFTDTNAKHILVLKNGHYFVFDVFKDDGSILTLDEIYCNLKFIAESSGSKAEYSLGALTAENRDTWTLVRNNIEKGPSNANSLRLIDGALFALCLDEKECLNEKDDNETYLYGNPDNRWFDKSFQLILSKNGHSGIHFEHSWANGGTIMRYLNETYSETRADIYKAPKINHSHRVRQLTFNLSPTLVSSIETAKKKHHLATLGISHSFGKMEDLGKKFFKSHSVSADAMFQLAMQMAHYRLTGKVYPTVESCSTATFKHGRTEVIRSTSIATVACSEAFEKTHPAGIHELVKLLRKQSSYHRKLTREATMGQGFDRHLFALRATAEKLGKNVEFFNDPAYLDINRRVLYTNSIYSPNISLGGSRPVFSKGFSIGYLINDESLWFNINSFPESPKGADFAKLLSGSLYDIRAVLSGKNIK